MGSRSDLIVNFTFRSRHGHISVFVKERQLQSELNAWFVSVLFLFLLVLFWKFFFVFIWFGFGGGHVFCLFVGWLGFLNLFSC